MIVFECFLKARLAKRMSTGGELDRLPGEPLADITQEMPGRTVDPDHEVLAITRVPFVRIVDDRLNSVGQHTTHFDNLDRVIRMLRINRVRRSFYGYLAVANRP